jgi:hypothetical protein
LLKKRQGTFYGAYLMDLNFFFFARDYTYSVYFLLYLMLWPVSSSSSFEVSCCFFFLVTYYYYYYSRFNLSVYFYYECFVMFTCKLELHLCREWNYFNYEPKTIRVACEVGCLEGKDVVSGIKLPQFSSAVVPKVHDNKIIFYFLIFSVFFPLGIWGIEDGVGGVILFFYTN